MKSPPVIGNRRHGTFKRRRRLHRNIQPHLRMEMSLATWPTAENIYQMYMRNGGAGFFVKHRDWLHPNATALVVSIGGLRNGVLPGTPPLHLDTPDGRPIRVLAYISYRGETPILRELSRAGTSGYAEIERPSWWPARFA